MPRPQRVSEAARVLDADLSAFMSHALSLLRAAEAKRIAEVSQIVGEYRGVQADLGGRLSSSEASNRHLEAQSAAERLERLKAALRLTRQWQVWVWPCGHAAADSV